ncbi:GtrA family protein [Halobaculum litoreum]|uniref:GtrA family protein n=1 Tax=Halobaculum litoreum TaxID=3031998 RepID=UPI0024C3E195|nr:GtrA family protein [Halobaculum sp. DT92]
MSDDAGAVGTLASGTRIGQFVSVGVVGFVFDIATSTALREAGVFPELAAFIGIEVAVVVMFLLNDRVTFAEEGLAGLAPTLRRLAKSNVVRAGGIAVQLVVFTVLFRVVALPLSLWDVDLWFVVSRAGGIGAGMVVNYVAESVFTWRVLE